MNKEKIKKIFIKIGLTIDFKTASLALPVSFTKRYDYEKVIIDDTLQMIFIHEKRQGPIEIFVKHAEVLSSQIGLPYVLVFTSIAKDVKTMLLGAKIPFIDYKGNIFIPELGLILNNKPKNINFDTFTPSEQSILINIFLNQKNFIFG